MSFRFTYTVFFLSVIFSVSAQDILVSRDSSKIEILFLEICPTELHYKKTDNPNVCWYPKIGQ